ncbi:hypothetical protein SAMN05216522_1251, partial [Rosenbergiella nectarea]
VDRLTNRKVSEHVRLFKALRSKETINFYRNQGDDQGM